MEWEAKKRRRLTCRCKERETVIKTDGLVAPWIQLQATCQILLTTLFFIHSVESFTSAYWVPIQMSRRPGLLHNIWLHCVTVFVCLCVSAHWGVLFYSLKEAYWALFEESLNFWDLCSLHFLVSTINMIPLKSFNIRFCLLQTQHLADMWRFDSVMSGSLAGESTFHPDILKMCQLLQMVDVLREITFLQLLKEC